MSADRRPIVIKRKRKAAHGNHGAWKIAYADFMTAMMAFFLVMWLLSGLSNAEMAQVSEYFRTPLKVAMAGGDRNSASDSAIPGGGDDPMHADGEKALTAPSAKNYNPDRAKMSHFKQRLEAFIHEDPALDEIGAQIKVDFVPQGLRIQIMDSRERPMFALGSARIEPVMRRALEHIAPVLSEVPNRITLTGHTDNRRYAAGRAAYGNWELSSDRANASRRTLVAAGMSAGKLLRVMGAAATTRLAGDKPGAPANRRISIILLNQRAQAELEAENGTDARPRAGRPAKPFGNDSPNPEPPRAPAMTPARETGGNTASASTGQNLG